MLHELLVQRQRGWHREIADIETRGFHKRGELVGDRLGRWKADRWILRHHVSDDLSELLGDAVGGQRLDRFAGVSLKLLSDIAARERRLARDHLEQATSQGVDVGLGVGHFSRLLQFGGRIIGAGGKRAVGVDRLERPWSGQLRRILQQPAMALGVQPEIDRPHLRVRQLPAVQLR